MREETLVRMIKEKGAQIQGLTANYNKFTDPREFFAKINVVVNDLREILDELDVKKELER